MCRRFVMLCRELKLFSQALVAIATAASSRLSTRAIATSQRARFRYRWMLSSICFWRLSTKEQLKTEPDGQLSVTDPDARSMATSGKGSGMVGYNVQVAVDAKNHLIVAHEVTNAGSDRAQLSPIAKAARDAMGKTRLRAVADRGYYTGPQIKECADAGIAVMLPKPTTSGAKYHGRFDKAHRCLRLVLDYSSDSN